MSLLPTVERDAFLLRVARGEAQVDVELRRRLREVGGAKITPAAATARQTFAELKAAAAGQEQQREQRERAQAERARLARMESLAQREEQIWTSVPALLAKRTASGYDEGVALLADLRDLAVHRGQYAAFDARLAKVTAPYAGSPALSRRLKEKQLV